MACRAARRSSRTISHTPVIRTPNPATIRSPANAPANPETRYTNSNIRNASPTRPSQSRSVRMPLRTGSLYSGFRDAGLFFVRVQVVLGQSCFQNLVRGVDVVGEFEQFQILRRDHSVTDQGVEIDDLFPKRRAVQNHSPLLPELLRLHQGEDFRKFVQRAESAREHD